MSTDKGLYANPSSFWGPEVGPDFFFFDKKKRYIKNANDSNFTKKKKDILKTQMIQTFASSAYFCCSSAYFCCSKCSKKTRVLVTLKSVESIYDTIHSPIVRGTV